jgi:hypothetical integral membrane protein (TIGR02206 family)
LTPPFVLFGAAHLVVLALAFALPLGLSLFSRAKPARDRPVRWLLAAFLLAEWITFYAVFWAEGWFDWQTDLPLGLCDWAEAAMITALLRPNLYAYELGYFWGLGGSLQALLTPDLGYGFPDPRFLLFMADHAGIIAALVYLTLGTGFRPLPRSLPRVIVASFGYLFVAGGADYVLGTNYGYLRDKGGHVSLLTWLSPWPWYVGELVLIGFLSLALYYAPFFFLDFFKGRTAERKTAPKS